MKNKKIISLTVVAVALVLAGILGLSKVFENGWLNENTVDNSLNVEIIENNSSVFNYPFVSAQQAVDEGYGPANEALSASKLYSSTYEDNMIEIQKAVNIAGETIKYLTGYTGHQKLPVMAQLINQVNDTEGIYQIMHYKNFVSDTPEQINSDYVKGYDMQIDAITGIVCRILMYYDFDVEIDGALMSDKISEAKQSEIIDYVIDILALIYNDSDVEITNINIQTIRKDDYSRHQIRFTYNDLPCWITLEEPFGGSIYYVYRCFYNYE